MKSWRGDYVIVFPHERWHFHKCVVCGRDVAFGTQASKEGIGLDCSLKPAWQIEQAKREAVERDRQRYRREVLKPGFKIE
jgi:hypothetical protein